MSPFCMECGTQHHLEDTEWTVFRAGPHIEEVCADTRFYSLQRVAEDTHHTFPYSEEAIAEAQKFVEAKRKERRAAYLKALAAAGQEEGVPVCINLMPSRRERWRRSPAAHRLEVIAMLPIVIIVGGPLLLGAFVQERVWALPYYRRRLAEEVAASRALMERRRHETWRIVPLQSRPPQDQPKIDEVRRWLSGVLCDHCGALGSLRFEWESIYCPLCKNAPLIDGNIQIIE